MGLKVSLLAILVIFLAGSLLDLAICEADSAYLACIIDFLSDAVITRRGIYLYPAPLKIHASTFLHREPQMTDTPEVRAVSPHAVIIGTGFGGLCMAIQLKMAGIHSFTMLEKASNVGGTWRDNTYPGAACDVQSHLYSYSFEPKHDWTRKFGLQAEIRQYMEDCVEKYDLASHIQFNKDVVAANYDDTTHQWVIDTQDGAQLRSNILVTACGQLNRPAFPNIKGMEDFKGKVFHSARWDHDHNLDGESVAVIGTGASAIQFVPQITPRVKQLKLFQRSAAWVLPKADRLFAGWEQSSFKNMPLLDRIYRTMIYWKNESRALAFTRFNALLNVLALQAKYCAKRDIKDPIKRAKVIPDYKIGCKRILISNDWYKAINSDNLDVINDGIDHIEADAIVSKDGSRHAVDTIIYGTGFQATDFLSPINITGHNGVNLNDAWQDGAEAYKGITVSGFPNLFMLYGPNTNLAHNSIVFMIESQVRYVLSCLQALQASNSAAMNVLPDTQSEFVNGVQKRLEGSVWASGCTSWYTTASGKNPVNWPGFTFSYRLSTRKVNLNDYQFYPKPVNA